MEKNEEIKKPVASKNFFTNIKAIVYFGVSSIIIALAMVIKFIIVKEISVDHQVVALILLPLSVVFVMGAMLFYMLHSRRSLINKSKTLYAVCAAVVFSYIVNIYSSMISIFAMPMALSAFKIAPLSRRRDAFVGNLFTNIMVLCTCILEIYYGASFNIVDVLAMFMVGVVIGTVVAYVVAGATDRIGFIAKGLLLGTISLVIIVLFTIFREDFAVEGQGFSQTLLNLVLMLIIGSYSPIILGLMLQPVYEKVFNLITNSRLVEFTDHNSPLIKRLRTEAPGTFNHSLAVANFAEMCATAIGENPYLARACAYYHDVGKLENPEYYKENQAESNLHDELLPEISAGIIRAHTTDGMQLCLQHRIPIEISHVTVQHHGKLLIPVFYEKAKKLTDSIVDEYEYSYHGTTPVTKVAAIIMLCDAGEAAIRAMDFPDGEKVDALLTGLIESRIKTGQFDNCDISLKDLDTIKMTIISAYGGLYHKRLKYPNGEDEK